MIHHKPYDKQRGVLLVQLLVGIAIGVFTVTMSVALYFDIMRQYTKTINKFVYTTNVGIVQQLFKTSINQSGLPGGFALGQWVEGTIQPNGIAPINIFNYAPIYATSQMANADLTSGKTANTDVLMVQGINRYMTTNDPIAAADTQIDIGFAVRANRLLMLMTPSLASASLVATSSDENNGTVELQSAPNHDFPVDSFLGRYYLNVYYIAPTGEQDNQGNAIDALYERHIFGTSANLQQTYPIINHVSDMQIQYYTDDGGWQAVQADNDQAYRNQWYRLVKGLRITVTMDRGDGSENFDIVIPIRRNLT